ncbi:uncharacterized protein [Primulina eburnea]|uniref:uncharacterized protein n=1 Tax=Primulina eburnea TaxID=1245227 RepID=UPI003C6BF4AE
MDQRRRDLELAVGDHVFIKIEPMKGVMRFGKKGKLSPRFIRPFEILERLEALAYRVALPPKLAGVHNVFHISMLRKHMSNPSHFLNFEPLQFSPNLSYEERPTQILGRQERNLRNKVIKMVKVKWLNHSEEEATGEIESEMKSRYPELFGAGVESLGSKGPGGFLKGSGHGLVQLGWLLAREKMEIVREQGRSAASGS